MKDSILAIDIGATNIISIVATNDLNNKINILGVNKSQSHGIEKGNIVDINLAGNCIKDSVANAIKSSGSSIDKAIVSISGSNTKTSRSNASINIPSGQITQIEIRRVLKMALYNANIIPDYDAIHVLPISFKVDDGNSIFNPMNMNGSRLEVSVNVITAKKTSLINIKNALKIADLDVDKFVLSGYASAISILNEDQKKRGTIVLNLGGNTSQLVVFKDSVIIYNDFVPIGSENITNDISIMLNTPYSASNMVKKKYGTLLPTATEDNSENIIKKIKLPILGNETETKEISLTDQIQPILHARVEEILLLIHDRLAESSVIDSIDGGVVLTGGMTMLPGIKELASLVFYTLPVKISNPKNIKNGYVSFDDPTMSTIAGLLLYELDNNDNFELDSNSNIRAKITKSKSIESELLQEVVRPNKNKELNNIANINKPQPSIDKSKEKVKKKKNVFSAFLDKIARWI